MEGWQRRMGGCRREWGKRSRWMWVHSWLFVLATFDETTLILKPVGDAGEREKSWSGQCKERRKREGAALTSDKSW